MAFEAAILSVIVALIRRGRLQWLADLKINGFWLIFVPTGLIVASVIIAAHTAKSVWVPVTGWMHILAYAILLVFFWSNRDLPGMKWFLGGWFLNLLPIATNGGKMPVSVWAVNYVKAGDAHGVAFRHVEMSSQTHFNFLADFIPIPSQFEVLRNVISPGDILMAIGVFLLIQLTMCPRKTAQKSDGNG